MKRYLCISLLYACCMATAYAQYSPQPREVDVLYFKDGGVLRGKIVGKSGKNGKIRLYDGSVIVYKKFDVRMTSKELLQASEQSVREDSLKIVGITKKVLEEEAGERRASEELRALRQMADANLEVQNSQPEDEPKKARLYSVIDAGVGIGFGDMPTPKGQSALSDNANTCKFTDVRYAVGGRGKHFGLGLHLGVQQLRKSGRVGTLTDSSGNVSREPDSIPSNLLFLPVGLDMRLEFLPGTPVSPFISANTTYTVNLNSGKDKDTDGFFTLNPAVGLRFGRGVSSLLSLGFQFHIEPNGDTLNFVTLRFGLIF
ncbi:MAG: hypothetical protein LBB79_00990 [Prevotellaceae bacterium]|nr:hypothetical protein [Prevotellaceae bacterium]